MGLTREPNRLPSPVFPFSLGFLGACSVGDQTKSGHPRCVLVGSHRWYFQSNFRFRSGADMKPGLRELTALSLLAAFCCGLAWAHDDTFFAAVFWRRQRNDNYRGDTAFTVRCRRSAQTQHPSSVAQSLLSKSKRITVCHLTTDQPITMTDQPIT